MTAEVVMLADCHLKNTDPLGRGVGVQNTRTKRKLAMIRRSLEFFTDGSHYKVLAFLGDVFDSPVIREDVREGFASVVAAALSEGINVWYIEGNHSRLGALSPLRSEGILPVGAGSAEFVVVPTGYKTFYIGEQPFVLMPYAPTEDLVVQLQHLEVPPHTILLGHFPVTAGRRFFGDAGGVGVPTELLGQFGHVFLGDYHLHQLLSYTRNCWGRGYVGSMAATDFGEIGYEHRAARLQLGLPGTSLEWVDMQDDPMVSLTLNSDGTVEDWAGLIDSAKDGNIPAMCEGALVRLQVHGTREQLAHLDVRKLVQRAESYGAQYVRVETIRDDEPAAVNIDQSGDAVLDPAALIRQSAGGDVEREKVGLGVLRMAQRL